MSSNDWKSQNEKVPTIGKSFATVKPGYKMTEVGVIPEEWEVKPLSAISDKMMVGIASAATHAYRAKGVPMFRNQNIKIGFLDDSDLLFIDPEYEVVFKNKRLRGGDLLTMRTGYPGVTAMVPPRYDSAQSFTTLITRPKQQEAESPYLCHFINSACGQRFFAQSQIGGAQKNVNVSTLRNMPIILPKPPEQRAIAEALSDVDGLLGALDRLIAKKRDLKQAAMQQLLTGQTRLPGFHGEWEVKRLGDIAQADWGNTSITKSAYQDYGYPAYSASGCDGYVSWFEHEGAGVVISAIGAQCGKTWLVRGKWTPIKNTIWFKANDTEASTEFLYWKTCDRDFWPKSGQAQPFVSVGSVRNACIQLPPTKSEQTAIAAVLSDMDAELAALEQRREKTRALKQGMMQELLTGRIRLI